jgi:spermidine/putrescine transport system substrate-binding protein
MKHHYPQPRHNRSSRSFSASRRRFLQTSAAALSGLALSNCRRGISDIQGGAPSNAGATGTGSQPGTLHIYTWADYTDDRLAQLFTERTGINVVIDIYDSNEVMLAKMQAGGGDAYSIIYPSDYMVEEMIGLGMLTELDHSRINGLDTLFPQWQNPSYDPGNVHSVPMSWGTTGLLYNSGVLDFAPDDWSDLWDNQDALFRRMTLLDDVREVMGATLRSLGYSYNATDPAEIEAAFERLLELRPAIASFQSFGWEDQVLSGDLSLVMAYSVDAIAATKEDPNMVYVVPSSGSSLWTDTMVIPTSAPNPDAAYAWINLCYEAEVSADLVSRLFFATPIQPAFDLLPEALQTNDDLFPPEDILARCEGIAPVGEALELYDRFWTELTSV